MKKIIPVLLASALAITPVTAFANEEVDGSKQSGSVQLQKYNSNFATETDNNKEVAVQSKTLFASVSEEGKLVLSDEILKTLTNAVSAQTKVVGQDAVITVTDTNGTVKEIKVPLSALTTNATSQTNVTNTTTTKNADGSYPTVEYYGYKFFDLGDDKLKDQATGRSVSKKKLAEYAKPEDKGNLVLSEEQEYALLSNDDNKRREALESMAGVKLDNIKIWTNSESTAVEGTGVSQTKNTSVADLKSSGNYALNANRQELIFYALETGDWQPYRKMEYKQSPLYFHIDENGEYQYNKVYYAKFVQLYLQNIKDFKLYGKDHSYSQTTSDADILKILESNLKEYIKKYHEAKGPEMYIWMFNNDETTAKENGTTVVPNEFFYSPYNNPNVLSKGTFQ